MDARAHFEGKHITVMGLGLLGRGVGDAQFLASCGAHLTITDLKSREELATSLNRLSAYTDIEYVLGEHRLEDFENKDFILKAAGVPLESPYIAHAHAHNVPVRMSADLFAEVAGIPVIGITGTRGKSTVTQMIYEILRAGGKHVVLGGNVRGVSTLSLLKEVTSEHMAVLELDSWQCHGFGEVGMSPHIAVFTTFMDDHLVYYHNDLDLYFADKAHIYLHQSEKDTLILGSQVAPLALQKHKEQIRSRIITPEPLSSDIHLSIPGEHNRYNASLALAVSDVLEVPKEIATNTLMAFSGVEGRLQVVREVNGVRFVNDTNATTPDATLAGLTALSENKNVILIMGGHDKGIDMKKLTDAIPTYAKRVLLLAGTGTNRVLPTLADASVFDSLQGAFNEAVSYAQPGDVVLMSPAFASFGMFKNEYDRGDQFVELVRRV